MGFTKIHSPLKRPIRTKPGPAPTLEELHLRLLRARQAVRMQQERLDVPAGQNLWESFKRQQDRNKIEFLRALRALKAAGGKPRQR